MLRTDFPYKIERWPQRLLAVVLGEAFLGFLAIMAAALTLFPMLFAVKPAASAAIDGLQWGIIAWFGVEYVIALVLAREKRVFLTSPWRLIDLATVIIPLASLLPSASRALRSSPVLRLVRLIRLVTLGVRASGVVVRGHTRHAAEQPAAGPARVTALHRGTTAKPVPVTLDHVVQWLKNPDSRWFHVSNPSPADLKQIATAAALPEGFLETHLEEMSYPHLASARSYTAIFLWLPQMTAAKETDRHAVLFLAGASGLLSFSRRPTPLLESIATAGDEPQDEAMPFVARTLALVVRGTLRQNERLVGIFEHGLRLLEDVPIRESRPSFFEDTFRLKKELSAAQADLWRLKSVLSELAEGRTRLPGNADPGTETFGRLAANADYLYETNVNIREEILSVIELHLNVVSFDMNRVMRVLAVVSVLGLIPAVVGGLFGMNLIDNPWPFTLPQVAFAICLGMVLTLYFFFVKGWLR